MRSPLLPAKSGHGSRIEGDVDARGLGQGAQGIGEFLLGQVQLITCSSLLLLLLRRCGQRRSECNGKGDGQTAMSC